MLTTQLFFIFNQLVTMLFAYDDINLLSSISLSLFPLVALKKSLHKTWFFILIPLSFFMQFQAFGKLVSPESAFHFLAIMCTLKALQLNKTRDFIVLAAAHILLLATLSLLTINIFVMLFIFISFILLFIILTNKEGKLELDQFTHKISSLLKSILYISPLFILIFFLFPRFKTNLFNLGLNNRAEIGYRAQIKLNEVSEIFPSTKEAFKVFLSPDALLKPPFYIRGSTLEYTDGLNWFRRENYTNFEFLKTTKAQYALEYSDPSLKDLFLIEPITIPIMQSALINDNGNSFKKSSNTLMRYEVSNSILELSDIVKRRHRYLPLPSNRLTTWVNNIAGQTAKDIIAEFKQKIQKENFSYSLSPGRMSQLDDFLEKKIGYCNHYSSLLAMTLRIKGIPTRVVSGFLGGQFNEYGQYYLIKMNDAHSWVEYFDQNQWHRIDPTLFVYPILSNVNRDVPQVILKNSDKLKWLLKFKMSIEYANYKLNLFLENFDRSYQTYLASLLNIKLSFFYIMLPIGVVLFLMIFWVMKSQNLFNKNNEKYLLALFFKKYKLNNSHANDFLELKKKIPENAIEDFLILEDFLFNPSSRNDFKSLKSLLTRKQNQ
jgi:transglutaminase-like putative cysteine protease